MQFLFLRIFVFYKQHFFNNIFNVNSVTNLSNNDFYITCLFDWDNRFLVCNYKVTGKHRHISSKKKKSQICPKFLS